MPDKITTSIDDQDSVYRSVTVGECKDFPAKSFTDSGIISPLKNGLCAEFTLTNPVFDPLTSTTQDSVLLSQKELKGNVKRGSANSGQKQALRMMETFGQ